MQTVQLATPSLPLLVEPATFDDFAWCPGTTLEWRRPGNTEVDALPFELNDLDDDLPLRLAFVFREPHPPLPVLPGELARLHTGRAQAEALGLTGEMALAPYAIDDATDQLHAHRRPPTETFWLAADNLNALYWALHDWAHFHNHGPFTDRPATELQCDAAALAWLWLNRAAVPLPMERWQRLRLQVLENHVRLRRTTPGSRCPSAHVLASPDALRELFEPLHQP